MKGLAAVAALNQDWIERLAVAVVLFVLVAVSAAIVALLDRWGK